MKFLERINVIKDHLGFLEQEAGVLDTTINEKLSGYFESIRSTLNEMATLVETEAREKDAKNIMKVDLLAQMAGKAHLSSLSLEQRDKISDKILEDPSLSLLTEDELRKYITREINNLDNEALALLAYEKEDFIRIGKTLLPDGTPSEQYERGKLSLIGELDRISEFENALSSSLTKVMRDPAMRNEYVLKYYGLDA